MFLVVVRVNRSMRISIIWIFLLATSSQQQLCIGAAGSQEHQHHIPPVSAGNYERDTAYVNLLPVAIASMSALSSYSSGTPPTTMRRRPGGGNTHNNQDIIAFSD